MGPRTAIGLGVLAGALAARPAPARADLPPITDRNYAIDLYSGAALGTARIVGMGGAATADAEGSAGTVANPAAPAIRSATSTSDWDWDFHVDGQSAIYASDLDNNGRDRGGGARLATAGLAGMYREWGLAVVVTTQSSQLGGTATGSLDATATRARIALARTFAGEAITVGLAFDVGTFTLAETSQIPKTTLFEIAGSTLAAGAVWRPPHGDWRVGAAGALPVSGKDVSVRNCDPNDCGGLILPDRVEAPWQLGAGVAWRHGESRWNQWVGGSFRDEGAVLVALDVIVTGRVPDGFGLEAFGEGLAQPSGRHVVASARGGVEWELLPGHLRLRGGTYWEPGRFDGVGGRPHLTVGVEGGAIEFTLWGRHRMRMSLTADLAPRYGNASLSLGFWH